MSVLFIAEAIVILTRTGAVIFERQANEKSDIARKRALYSSLNYHYWWDMPFLFWCASFYNNATLLSDATAYQYAGL